MSNEYRGIQLTPAQLADPSWIDNAVTPYQKSPSRYIEYVAHERKYTLCVPCAGGRLIPGLTKWRPIKA